MKNGVVEERIKERKGVMVICNLLSSTGAASELSEGMIKPNPFWLLKNLTFPVLRAAEADIFFLVGVLEQKEKNKVKRGSIKVLGRNEGMKAERESEKKRERERTNSQNTERMNVQTDRQTRGTK